MKVRDLIHVIEEDGPYLVATPGSHRRYGHPLKPGRVALSGKSADDVAPVTLNSVWKQAGMEGRTR